MTGHKDLEKSLKKQDSLQSALTKGLDFIVNNKRQIALFLSPLLVIGLIGYSFYSWNQRKATHRRVELSKIMAVQTEEQANVTKKRDEIQKEIESLRSTKPGPDGKPAEVSAESLAKITTLQSQILSLQPDNSKSTAAYKEFYEKNKNNAEGWMAGLTWAGRTLKTGKPEDVKPVVEEITKLSGNHKFYQITSRFMLIALFEDLGDFDGGIKECDILQALVHDDGKASVLLAKGRLLYFKKSFEDARKPLSEVVEKHASSPEAAKARMILSAMGPTA